MKHLHMLMAVLLIALFLYQSYVVLGTNKKPPFAVKISTHILYAVIIISGAGMLVQLMSVNAPVQWVFGVRRLHRRFSQRRKRPKVLRPCDTVDECFNLK